MGNRLGPAGAAGPARSALPGAADGARWKRTRKGGCTGDDGMARSHGASGNGAPRRGAAGVVRGVRGWSGPGRRRERLRAGDASRVPCRRDPSGPFRCLLRPGQPARLPSRRPKGRRRLLAGARAAGLVHGGGRVGSHGPRARRGPGGRPVRPLSDDASAGLLRCPDAGHVPGPGCGRPRLRPRCRVSGRQDRGGRLRRRRRFPPPLSPAAAVRIQPVLRRFRASPDGRAAGGPRAGRRVHPRRGGLGGRRGLPPVRHHVGQCDVQPAGELARSPGRVRRPVRRSRRPRAQRPPGCAG